MLRSVLEQATHRIVVRRRLPDPFAAARIYVSSEGGLRFLAHGMTRVDPDCSDSPPRRSSPATPSGTSAPTWGCSASPPPWRQALPGGSWRSSPTPC